MKKQALSILTAVAATASLALAGAGVATAGSYGGIGDPASCSGSSTIASRGIYSSRNGKYLGVVEFRIGNCPGGAGAWAKTTSAIGSTAIVANFGRTTGFYDQAHSDVTSAGTYTRYLRYDYGRTQFCANGAIRDPATGNYAGDTICYK